MKYLITGGGTGGHIYPALAIAEEIRNQDKQAEILYVGTKNSMEAKLVPRAGLNFRTVRVKYLPRKINLDFFRSIKELILGINDSRKIIKDFKPDLVIGTGGYVCGPVVLMGAIKGVPSMIHEQNAYPGITNKILARFVDTVMVTFDDAIKYFKNQEKIVVTGNPIRKDILSINKDKSYDKLGIDRDDKFILSFGGSGGQKSLNDAIIDMIPFIDDKIQWMHITGERLYEDFYKELDERGIDLKDNIKILSYMHDMPDALNIADLVVTPAGAITLAEISAIGLASILVPKSYTAENHQEHNARYFYNNGAARLILEDDLREGRLREEFLDLINKDEELDRMRENSKKLGKTNASKLIFKEIENLLNK